jgi:tetratricopeptide (TPR) repeat protein
MTSNTTVAVTPHGENQRSARTPASLLWQVPVFLLGIAALVSVWLSGSIWQVDPALQIERDLATAREILSRADGDAEFALQLASRAREAPSIPPERLGEASLLAGTAQLRLAEKADPSQAQEAWKRARVLLEHAESAGVSEEDRLVLMYRLARVGFYTGEARQRVIARLEESAVAADNRVEAYSLLQQAYLQLNPPDLIKALSANARLRNVPEITENELSQAKLVGGELLLRLGKPEEARRSLEKISNQAPPALLSRARLLQARAFQEEHQYDEAAQLYRAVLADARVPVEQPGQVYYSLGQCYLKLEQPQEAARAWMESIRLAQGDDAAASAACLTELRLHEKALEQVLEGLQQIVARVEPGSAWRNQFVDLTRAREVFEKAISSFRQADRHDLASKALEFYARLAEPRRLLMLQGEIPAEWARVRREQAIGGLTNEQEQQVASLYRQASRAFAQLAQLPDLSINEQADYLWQSGQYAAQANDYEQAVALLTRLTQMPIEVNRMGEAWYRLAELHRANKKIAEADRAYRECVKYDTRFAYRAQYQIAQHHLSAGQVDRAEEILLHNITMLNWDSDKEALEQSLFALGNLVYQRRDYRRAARYLEQAVGRFKDNPEATRARFQLADCYRQIAAQETQSFLLDQNMSEENRKHLQQQHRRWLRQAAQEFSQLERFLESPEGAGHLTAEQRAQVPFIAARCWYNLGEYETALQLYEKLIERHSNKPAGLDALGGAVACHAALGQEDKVKQRLLQMKKLLPSMPPELQKPWEQWLAAALETSQQIDQENKRGRKP